MSDSVSNIDDAVQAQLFRPGAGPHLSADRDFAPFRHPGTPAQLRNPTKPGFETAIFVTGPTITSTYGADTGKTGATAGSPDSS